MRLAVIAAAGLLVAACTTLDETECRNADWYLIGVEDGRGGWSEDRLENHREACAELDVTPDAERYAAGREVGLVEYCTPTNGVNEGAQGHIYRGVCPEETRSEFLRGFRLGEDIHETQDEIRDLEREMHDMRRVFDDQNAPAAQRDQAWRRYQELDRQRSQLQFELQALVDRARRI